jgi:hypothetical protein
MRRRAASMSIRPLMMKPSRKISFRRATRAQSILFDTECPGPVVSATESRSGPGPSAREQGTRVPPLAVMNSTVKHSAQHVGGSWPRFNEPGVTGVISSALGVFQLCFTIGGKRYGRHKCDDRRSIPLLVFSCSLFSSSGCAALPELEPTLPRRRWLNKPHTPGMKTAEHPTQDAAGRPPRDGERLAS